jgi:hypothetical protein
MMIGHGQAGSTNAPVNMISDRCVEFMPGRS